MCLTVLEAVIDVLAQRVLIRDSARYCVSALGGAVCAVCGPAGVLESLYRGVAPLGTLP